MKRVIFFLLICVFSCSSKKNILYLQNKDISKTYNIVYNDHKINVDDVLRIIITTEDPEVSLTFNPPGLGTSSIANTKEIMLFNGYQVDPLGFIHYPGLGQIYVEDMSIPELRTHLYDLIINNKILNNPSVDVKLLNGHFTILGEVNRPGKYEFLQNNINILEAIGQAGDLSINGERDNILLIRDIDGDKKIYNVDLTKVDFFQSEFFQIQSGDIILVNPNTARVKNAGIIGNSGTLLSLLSFILSSIIVATR